MPLRRLIAGLAILGAGSLAACDGNTGESASSVARPIGDAHAIETCRARTSSATKLRAAFDTTSKVVVDWLNSKNPPNFGRVVPQFFEARSDADPIAVCIADGLYKGGPGVAADRGVHVVDMKGESASLMAASRKKLPLIRPEVALRRPTTTTVPQGALRWTAGEVRRVHGGPSSEADSAKVPSQCRTDAVALTLGF